MKKERIFLKPNTRISLQTRLTAIILLAILIPLSAIVFLLAGRIQPMISAETIREEQVQTSKAAPIISQTLYKIVDISKSIRAGDIAIDKAIEYPVVAIRQYVDLPADDPFFTQPGHEPFTSIEEVKGTYWHGIFSSSSVGSLFCPSRYLGVKERKKYADCAYIAATRINDPELGSMITYLVLYFPSEVLQDILTENLTRSGSLSYIANERDEMITSTDANLSGIYYMDYNTIQTSLMSSNGFLEKEVLNDTVYVSYFYLPPADWYLVTVTPEAPLDLQANNVLMIIVTIYIASVFAAMVTSSFLARSISIRIETVSKQMSSVRTGLPVAIDLPSENDEIGELVDSYNYMVQQINQLMKDQKNAAEELRIAEFRSLQAQINPHFLFNTMEMINQLASTGQIEKTNEAITALSHFYRLTLSRKETMTTIEKELEHAETYVKIQNMRFDDGIDFVVDIPDELLDYSIPKLTLQPILENSILHGILERHDRKGTIVLTGWLENKDIILIVSDNGVGMSSERMDKILTGELKSGQGSQIAVVNTHRRLILAFGAQYGLSYKSTPGKGTDVTIRLAAILNTSSDSLGTSAP